MFCVSASDAGWKARLKMLAVTFARAQRIFGDAANVPFDTSVVPIPAGVESFIHVSQSFPLRVLPGSTMDQSVSHDTLLLL